jgi:hypothetical protein
LQREGNEGKGEGVEEGIGGFIEEGREGRDGEGIGGGVEEEKEEELKKE